MISDVKKLIFIKKQLAIAIACCSYSSTAALDLQLTVMLYGSGLCVPLCVRVCVCAWVRACVHACMRARAYGDSTLIISIKL